MQPKQLTTIDELPPTAPFAAAFARFGRLYHLTYFNVDRAIVTAHPFPSVTAPEQQLAMN